MTAHFPGPASLVCAAPLPAHTPAKPMTPETTPTPEQLLQRMDHALIRDRHRLRRQLHELRKHPDDAKLAQWAERFQASCAKVEARRASIPKIR